MNNRCALIGRLSGFAKSVKPYLSAVEYEEDPFEDLGPIVQRQEAKRPRARDQYELCPDSVRMVPEVDIQVIGYTGWYSILTH